MYDELSNKLQTEYVTVVCLVAEATCSVVDCASMGRVALWHLDFQWEQLRSVYVLLWQIGRHESFLDFICAFQLIILELHRFDFILLVLFFLWLLIVINEFSNFDSRRS